MLRISPPTSSSPFTALLLGSGELGREVAIELMRYGVKVVAADRYPNAPAQLIANEFRVLNMNSVEELTALIEEVQPDVVIPEIEAIATEVLADIEKNGLKSGKNVRITPSAKAVNLTMNREGIRKLAAEELQIPTSKYRFASSLDELIAATEELGFPVVVKPIQSSSGKGQSVAKTFADVETSWNIAQTDARGKSGGVDESVRVICESFVDFDYEITLLTLRASNGVFFLDPIGHKQVDGDYRISWQESIKNGLMTEQGLKDAQKIADKVTAQLVSETQTGWGIFGVELFIKKHSTADSVTEEVIFSEVSPRPHDTGMVTLISTDKSQFALHARALLGFPLSAPERIGNEETKAVSVAVLAHGNGEPTICNIENTLLENGSNSDIQFDLQFDLKIFGKPHVDGERRVAVLLARSSKLTLSQLKDVAEKASEKLKIEFS